MNTPRFAAICLLAATVVPTGCGPGSSREMIQNKGSDTLLIVAQAWAENFRKVNSDVAVAVAGGGSGTGISSMINGTVDIANSSREMKQEEIEAAEGNGVHPLKHVVGHDAIAIFVHKDNPIDKITLEQLAEIYGEGGKIQKWSDLGITLPDAKDDEIARINRQNNSGTYEYFREAVLGMKRDFAMGSRDLNGTKDVVEVVSGTRGAIGYGGIAYASDEIKLIPIVNAEGTPVEATVATAISGAYPLARPLLMYTSGEPTGKIKNYLDWILSDDGQKILVKEGYAPVRNLP